MNEAKPHPPIFYIDNSFLELLQTCPRALLYNRIEKRVPTQERPSLNFGKAAHQVWEHRYRSIGAAKPTEALESEQVALLEGFFARTSFPEGDFRDLNWAIEVFVKRYNKHYGFEPFSILVDVNGNPMIEVEAAVPWFWIDPAGNMWDVSDLDDRPTNDDAQLICFCGLIDLVVKWHDRITLIDHKTTSILGQGFWNDQKVNPQFLGYAWLFHKTTGILPNEFVVNAVRVRPLPTRTPQGGYTRWWEESFHRDGGFVTEENLAEWEENTRQLIQEFVWYANRNSFPMKRKWCCGKYGKCAYYDVCTLPRHQRSEILASTFFTDNTWSPIKQTPL